MSDEWEKLRINHDNSCEEMEAQPNSNEYWKKLEDDYNDNVL